MNLQRGVCVLASLLGLASAASLGLYLLEGMSDTYPTWILLGLGLSALVQAAASVWLFAKRSIGAAALFLAVSTVLAAVEITTAIAVHLARNYVSTLATIAGLTLLVLMITSTRKATSQSTSD
jgi:hypothetical protein